MAEAANSRPERPCRKKVRFSAHSRRERRLRLTSGVDPKKSSVPHEAEDRNLDEADLWVRFKYGTLRCSNS